MRVMRLLRLQGADGVCARLAHRPTTAYGMVNAGTLPPPIKFGRSSCWPEHEIDAIVGAIVAGRTEDEIRVLVQALLASRSSAAPVSSAA